jgi:hypothetical protein
MLPIFKDIVEVIPIVAALPRGTVLGDAVSLIMLR